MGLFGRVCIMVFLGLTIEGCYQSSTQTELSRYNCDNPPPLVPTDAFTHWGSWANGRAAVENELVFGVAGTCNNILVGLSERSVSSRAPSEFPNETLALSIRPGIDTESTFAISSPYGVATVNAPYGYVVQSPDLERGLQVISLHDQDNHLITSFSVDDSQLNAGVDYNHFVVETTGLPLLAERTMIERGSWGLDYLVTSREILPTGELRDPLALAITTTSWWHEIDSLVANDDWYILADFGSFAGEVNSSLHFTFVSRDYVGATPVTDYVTVQYFTDNPRYDVAPHPDGVLVVMNNAYGGIASVIHPDGTKHFETRLPGNGSSVVRTPYGFAAASFDDRHIYVTIVDTVTAGAQPQLVAIDAFPEGTLPHAPQLGVGYYGYRLGVSASWYDEVTDTLSTQYHIVGAHTPDVP